MDKVPAPLKVLINSVHPCLPQASATYSSMQSAPARTEVLLRVVILLLLAQHGHLDPDARSKPNFENICTEQTTYKKRAPVQRTGGNSASPIASTQTHALRRSLQPRPPSIWADHAVDLSKNLVVSLSFHAPIFVRLSNVTALSARLENVLALATNSTHYQRLQRLQCATNKFGSHVLPPAPRKSTRAMKFCARTFEKSTAFAFRLYSISAS